MSKELTDRDKLVEVLLECDCMKTALSRNTIVQDLPADIQQRLRAGGTAREDVNEIVRVCSQFPNGLEKLLQRVRSFEGETYAWTRVEEISRKKLSRPGLGDAVFRLCNRDNHEDDFDDFIRSHTAHVLLCGIPAEKRECPDSLGKRFTDTIVRDYVRDRWGEQEGVLSAKSISWPDPADTIVRRQRLLTRIYRDLEVGENRSHSAEAFAQAVSGKLEKVIVLRHNINVERWERDEKELLQWYLRFWDEVNDRRPNPQFVILLNFIYPEKSGSTWLASFWGARFDRTAFNRQVTELFTNEQQGVACPKRLLDELPCINEKHVKDWFDRHSIFDEGERIGRCKELFKKSRCRPMSEIEKMLKQYHEEFLQQRG